MDLLEWKSKNKGKKQKCPYCRSVLTSSELDKGKCNHCGGFFNQMLLGTQVYSPDWKTYR